MINNCSYEISIVIHNLSNILERVYEKGIKGKLRRRVLRYLAESSHGEPNNLSLISKSKEVHSSPSNVIPVLKWLLKNGFVKVTENAKSHNRVSRTYDITDKGIVFVLGFIECDQEKILRKHHNYMPFINEATFLSDDQKGDFIRSANIVTFQAVDFLDGKSVKYDWQSIIITLYNAYMPFIMQRIEQKSEPIVLTNRYRKSVCDVADRFEMHAKILRKFAVKFGGDRFLLVVHVYIIERGISPRNSVKYSRLYIENSTIWEKSSMR